MCKGIASLEAKRKFIAPKIAAKHQSQQKLSPFSSENDKFDLSPSCTEEIITPPIIDKKMPMHSSPAVGNETPSQDPISSISSVRYLR